MARRRGHTVLSHRDIVQHLGELRTSMTVTNPWRPTTTLRAHRLSCYVTRIARKVRPVEDDNQCQCQYVPV